MTRMSLWSDICDCIFVRRNNSIVLVIVFYPFLRKTFETHVRFSHKKCFARRKLEHPSRLRCLHVVLVCRMLNSIVMVWSGPNLYCLVRLFLRASLLILQQSRFNYSYNSCFDFFDTLPPPPTSHSNNRSSNIS